MVANTLGTKYACFMCQCKFYDLNRPEPLCPRCGANQKEQPKPKATATRPRVVERVREEPYVPHVEDEEELVGGETAELGHPGAELGEGDVLPGHEETEEDV